MPLCWGSFPCPALGGGWDLAPVTRKGLHRLQALCRWVAWGPTGHRAAIPPDFPCHAGRAGLRCLRLLCASCCAAMRWSLRPVSAPGRRLTFGTFLRFPTQFSGIRFELSRRTARHERTLFAVAWMPLLGLAREETFALWTTPDDGHPLCCARGLDGFHAT